MLDPFLVLCPAVAATSAFLNADLHPLSSAKLPYSWLEFLLPTHLGRTPRQSEGSPHCFSSFRGHTALCWFSVVFPWSNSYYLNPFFPNFLAVYSRRASLPPINSIMAEAGVHPASLWKNKVNTQATFQINWIRIYGKVPGSVVFKVTR